MVMQPPVNGIPTLQFVNSAYSPGGAYFYAPTNTFNPYFNGTTGNPFAGTPVGNGYYNPGASSSGYSANIMGDNGGGGFMSPTDMYSGLKSAGNFISNGFSLPQSNFINDIGASIGFGSGAAPAIPSGLTAGETSFLQAAQTASGIGEGTAGALGTSTLSSTLGAAGIGAFAGSFLGRIGGNTTGGTIGGGLGAGIGMAVGGPVGGIIGGLIGGIGGGFFGGKPGTAASEGNYRFNADGSVVYTGGGEKNAGGYSGFNQHLGQMYADSFDKAKKYMTGLGIELQPMDFRAGVNTRHSPSGQPGYVQVGGQTFGFDPDNQDSINTALGQTLSAIAKAQGATDAQIAGMADSLRFDASAKGQGLKSMPKIKLTSGQFANYMAKFNSSEGNPPNVGT